MNQTHDTVRKMLAYGLAAILLASASLFSVAGANNDRIMQTGGGISYVSGGVGADSIARLDALAGDFNLKLVFALESGNYVSDVKVTIGDEAGRILINATARGPWFLAKLAAGNYQIVATFADRPVTRRISIGSAKSSTIDFRWPAE